MGVGFFDAKGLGAAGVWGDVVGEGVFAVLFFVHFAGSVVEVSRLPLEGGHFFGGDVPFEFGDFADVDVAEFGVAYGVALGL